MKEEEKPRSGEDSPKAKNPFSRVKEDKGSSTMRKSWSTDSLGLLSNSSRLGKTPCICAPTKHEGSFRCRLHRSSAGPSGSHGPPLSTPLDLPKSLLSYRLNNP